jgi:O-antigen ligase
MAGNFISSALSVIGHFSDTSRFSVDEGHRTEFIRSVGAETGPNDLAFVVLFSLPFFAAVFFSASSPRRRAFGGFGFAIGTAAIVLSYSRAGARILVLAVLLIAIEHVNRFRVRHLGLVIALVGAATFLVMALAPQSWWERQMSVSAATDSSVDRRASYLPVAFDAFLENPVLGTGTHTFKDVWAETSVSRKYPPGPDGSYRRVAHNSYAEVLTGAGGAGFLVFLVMIAVAIRGFGDSSRRFFGRGWPEEAAIARTYRTAFVLVLANFLFLTLNYHKYFWLSLAVSQVACRLSAADEADSGSAAVASA